MGGPMLKPKGHTSEINSNPKRAEDQRPSHPLRGPQSLAGGDHSLENQKSEPLIGKSPVTDPDIFGMGHEPDPLAGLAGDGPSPLDVSGDLHGRREKAEREQDGSYPLPSRQAHQSRPELTPERPSPDSTPREQIQSSTKKGHTKQKKTGSFAFIFMVFFFFGLLAFGAGAALAYYILNGDLDMNSSSVKDTLTALKSLFRQWGHTP